MVRLAFDFDASRPSPADEPLTVRVGTVEVANNVSIPFVGVRFRTEQVERFFPDHQKMKEVIKLATVTAKRLVDEARAERKERSAASADASAESDDDEIEVAPFDREQVLFRVRQGCSRSLTRGCFRRAGRSRRRWCSEWSRSGEEGRQASLRCVEDCPVVVA